jgi:hypothetical protein
LARIGDATELCGVPVFVSDHCPSSITPALSHFRISRRILGSATPTTWEWDIVPKHSGKKLRLHLAAVVELNGLSKDFTTVDRDIEVQVDPVDEATKFLKANWQWILTTIGAGLAGVWAWLKKRKKPAVRKWEAS